MGILFKTYNGKHQLHVYREAWVVKNKAQLEEILSMFSKKELVKAKITPGEDKIEIEMEGMIVDCRDMDDLKKKFGELADLKQKYQKVTVEPAAPKAKVRKSKSVKAE